MKIAFLVSTFPPYRGGMGNSAAAMARALVKLGHEVTVLTPNFLDKTTVSVDWEGIRVIRLKPALAIGNAAVLPEIFQYLKNLDVVHLHYPFYGTAELVAMAKLWSPRQLRLVLHYHMDTRAGGLKGLIFWLHKLIFLPLITRLAEAITCASLDYVKHSDIGAYYLKHRNKFIQVPFGVDTQLFKPSEATFNPDSANILFVGGLDQAHYFKGVDKLIEAFAIVVKQLPQARLTLIGSGDLEPIYHHLTAVKELTDKITFVNNVDNQALARHYQQTDVLVLPSINQGEAFGLVLLEAMACGKPVIASNLPGVRSVFKNGKQGFMTKPGDSEDLADKLLLIFKDAAVRRHLGEAARRLVEKRYSWDLAADRLNEIYHRVRFSPPTGRNH